MLTSRACPAPHCSQRLGSGLNPKMLLRTNPLFTSLSSLSLPLSPYPFRNAGHLSLCPEHGEFSGQQNRRFLCHIATRSTLSASFGCLRCEVKDQHSEHSLQNTKQAVRAHICSAVPLQRAFGLVVPCCLESFSSAYLTLTGVSILSLIEQRCLTPGHITLKALISIAIK